MTVLLSSCKCKQISSCKQIQTMILVMLYISIPCLYPSQSASHHFKCFATTHLSIGKYTSPLTLKGTWNQVLYGFIIDLTIIRILWKHVVKCKRKCFNFPSKINSGFWLIHQNSSVLVVLKWVNHICIVRMSCFLT